MKTERKAARISMGQIDNTLLTNKLIRRIWTYVLIQRLKFTRHTGL